MRVTDTATDRLPTVSPTPTPTPAAAKTYRITEAGLATARAEAQRLDELLELARTRLASGAR